MKWSSQCRYLGVYFVSGRVFRCSFDHSKCQFFMAFSAIFCKIGRYALEEVVLILLRSKCYGVESCHLLARDKRFLEFTVTRSFMKLFQTGSAAIVIDCQKFYEIEFSIFKIKIIDFR